MTPHAPNPPQAFDVKALGRHFAPRSLLCIPTRTVGPWLGLSALGVAAVLVFWAFDALPFQDLPAHAGLIALRHRFASSAFEREFFVYAPHLGPYSLFRFLGELFAAAVGPIGAVRALATLPVLATPAALIFARRRLHGETSPTWGYLGIVLSFGLMTLFGFASYLLAVAVLVAVLSCWLHLLVLADEKDDRAARRYELLIVLVAPFLFIAHGHAFLLFVALAVVSALSAGRVAARLARLRALGPALALAGYVAWVEHGGVTPESSVAAAPRALRPVFQGLVDKISLLVTPTLMTRSGIDAAISLLIWAAIGWALGATLRDVRRAPAARSPGALIGCAVAYGQETRSLRHSRALLPCIFTIAAVFVALPHSIGWFGFVDGRLVPVILLLALMAIRRSAMPVALEHAFDHGAPLLGATVVFVALVASQRFQAEASGYREVLQAIPAHARVLNLPFDPNSDVFTAHPFVHYDKLVLVERPIVVSDVWFHQGSALYPREQNPALGLPPTYCESNLRGFDWSFYRLDDWSHVLIRTRPAAAEPLTPPGLELAEHRGGWWLYRNRSVLRAAAP